MKISAVKDTLGTRLRREEISLPHEPEKRIKVSPAKIESNFKRNWPMTAERCKFLGECRLRV